MSKFVSSGTDQEPTERDSEWLEAQKAVEARHLAKIEAGKQQGGKSLYETLQANKDAKQEAFEESIRLRNQFRSLNDDEIEFLDSIAEAERSKEADVRREAKAQLESFKLLQEEAEKASKVAHADAEPAAAETWTSGARKRKKEKELPGIVKKRQLSNSTPANTGNPAKAQADASTQITTAQSPAAQSSKVKQSPEAESLRQPDTATTKKPLIGLADYSSDDD